MSQEQIRALSGNSKEFLEEDVELNKKTPCVSSVSKRRICNISGTAKLKHLGNIDGEGLLN